MAVSLGLALGALKPEAPAFVLWPEERKKRREFLNRGAYLYYAAALLLFGVGLFWWKPRRDLEQLTANLEQARAAVETALQLDDQLSQQAVLLEELNHRLEQIDTNVKSGDFFLAVFRKLKDRKRMPPDIWLTSICTKMPSVILADEEPGGAMAPLAGLSGALVATRAGQATADTFQAQSKIYIRGFVRANRKEDLLRKIYSEKTSAGAALEPGFCELLVPKPNEPNHPENVFTDIRPLWLNTDDQRDGAWWVKEFVLEAYVAGRRKIVKPKPPPPAVAPAVGGGARPAPRQEPMGH